jgi:hypothetical protein
MVILLATCRMLSSMMVIAAVVCQMLVVAPVDFDPVAPDTAAHVAVSYGLTLTGALLLEKLDVPRWQAVAIAGAGALALGLAKELVLDDTASGDDLLADGLGIGLAAGLVFTFEL